MPASSVAGNAIFGTIIKAKTASYTVTAAESGVMFTNRGATVAITFTLPAVSGLPIGTFYEFYGISATGFTVASNGSSDNIVALNDAAADSLTAATTSLIIGSWCKVIWDGTSWLSIRGAGNTFAVA
jgi:hypothetical protein